MRLILLILLSVSYADVIHVPADYSTIQEGIDAAAEDDIVVVSPATSQENLIIDKTITLTSLALFNTETETIIDSLDTWFDWGTTQYEITNDSILTTIIDGSQPVNDSLGSTILIKGAEGVMPEVPDVQMPEMPKQPEPPERTDEDKDNEDN